MNLVQHISPACPACRQSGFAQFTQFTSSTPLGAHVLLPKITRTIRTSLADAPVLSDFIADIRLTSRLPGRVSTGSDRGNLPVAATKPNIGQPTRPTFRSPNVLSSYVPVLISRSHCRPLSLSYRKPDFPRNRIPAPATRPAQRNLINAMLDHAIPPHYLTIASWATADRQP